MKAPDEVGLESDQKQLIGGYARKDSPAWAKARGWRTALYGNSLLLVMAVIFLGSWFGQSVTGRTAYNDDQGPHGEPTVSWGGYLLRPDFWENTLQNWQSEFLAVGTMAVFSAEWTLRRLREAGFSADVTYHAYHALDSHVLGFTLWQLGHGVVDADNVADLAATFFHTFPPEDYPYMHEHAQQHIAGFGRGEKGAFELVLDLILDGLDHFDTAEVAQLS